MGREEERQRDRLTEERTGRASVNVGRGREQEDSTENLG